jgi:hypothetical protein
VGADHRYFVSGCIQYPLNLLQYRRSRHTPSERCGTRRISNLHPLCLPFLPLPPAGQLPWGLPPSRLSRSRELVSVHVGTLGGSICGLVVSAKVIILKCLRDLRLDLGACKALSLKQHSENDRGCRNMCAIAHFLVRHRTRVAGIRNAVRTVPFASELELRNRCCTKSRYAGAATLNFARGMTTFWHNAERHRSPHDTMR